MYDPASPAVYGPEIRKEQDYTNTIYTQLEAMQGSNLERNFTVHHAVDINWSFSTLTRTLKSPVGYLAWTTEKPVSAKVILDLNNGMQILQDSAYLQQRIHTYRLLPVWAAALDWERYPQ